MQFVVETALVGDLKSLKERCIGTAVFGREAAYDTSQDPIVRNAAIDVRKRLAQYYLEPEHVCELRIDLPIGSYLPSFGLEPPAADVRQQARGVHRRVRRWVFALPALLLVGLAGAFLWNAR